MLNILRPPYNVYDGRSTRCTLAVIKLYGDRRTLSISTIKRLLYIQMEYKRYNIYCAALRINSAIKQLIAPSAAKNNIAGR